MLDGSALSLELEQTRPVCNSVTVFLHPGAFYLVLFSGTGLSCSLWLLSIEQTFAEFLLLDLDSQCWESVQSPSLYPCRDRLNIKHNQDDCEKAVSQILPDNYSLCSLLLSTCSSSASLFLITLLPQFFLLYYLSIFQIAQRMLNSTGLVGASLVTFLQ